MKNLGALLGRKTTDYIAGTLPFEERKPDGDWTSSCPPGEWQYKDGQDLMACVTFSALNSIEAQELHLTGKQVNYSDRWIAKMSGTTKQGNYLYKVADTIRESGLVTEEDYPTTSYAWDEYYADIPEPLLSQLKEKGQQWLATHQVNYEWLTVNDWNLDHHLKHAPIQVVIPGHAVLGIYSPAELMNYFDSYGPFFKNTPISNLADALKIVLTIKNMYTRYLVFHKPTGRMGVLVVNQTGFSDSIIWAKNQEMLEQLKVQFEIPANASTITIP